MAAGLGGALANTYLLPQGQPLAQPQKPQPYQDDIGNPEESLQQVDGVTSQYFDKWAQLKGFARDVWENYGIDVRYPDPSVPESNRMHRIYLKAIADLKGQGSKLKTSQQMLNASLSRGDLINVDTNKTAFSDTQPGVDVVQNELDPIVLQANDKLQQLYYDSKSLGEAKAFYEDIKKRLTAKAEENPNQREYWLRQIEGLTPPTSAAKQFAERADPANKDRNKINSAGAFLKKTTNLLNGTADSFKLSNSVFGANGERVYVSTDTAGDTYGGKQIVQWEFTPDTKETNLVVKDGNGQISRIPLTGADPMSIAKGYTTENPRYAANGEFLDTFADQAGLFKDTGEVDATSLISDQAGRMGAMQKEVAGIKAQKDAAQRESLAGKLSDMTPGKYFDFFNDSNTVTGSDGVPIKFSAVKGDGNKVLYDIDNIKDLIPGKKPEVYKAYKKMGKTALINFLTKRGAHLGEEVAEPTGATAPVQPKAAAKPKGKKVSRASVAGKVGQPGFEGYTEQELIDYYTNQGYTIE